GVGSNLAPESLEGEQHLCCAALVRNGPRAGFGLDDLALRLIHRATSDSQPASANAARVATQASRSARAPPHWPRLRAMASARVLRLPLPRNRAGFSGRQVSG